MIKSEAGIAAALSQLLQGEDTFFSTRFSPNQHVYQTLLIVADHWGKPHSKGKQSNSTTRLKVFSVDWKQAGRDASVYLTLPQPESPVYNNQEWRWRNPFTCSRSESMITITFPDRETEKRALGFLLGRFSGRVLKSGEHLVPDGALEALAHENIPFIVNGKTTYDLD